MKIHLDEGCGFAWLMRESRKLIQDCIEWSRNEAHTIGHGVILSCLCRRFIRSRPLKPQLFGLWNPGADLPGCIFRIDGIVAALQGSDAHLDNSRELGSPNKSLDFSSSSGRIAPGDRHSQGQLLLYTGYLNTHPH